MTHHGSTLSSDSCGRAQWSGALSERGLCRSVLITYGENMTGVISGHEDSHKVVSAMDSFPEILHSAAGRVRCGDRCEAVLGVRLLLGSPILDLPRSHATCICVPSG